MRKQRKRFHGEHYFGDCKPAVNKQNAQARLYADGTIKMARFVYGQGVWIKYNYVRASSGQWIFIDMGCTEFATDKDSSKALKKAKRGQEY